MNRVSRRGLFAMFFLSGFSGLVCQIIWLRLAFAAFGIITPVMSVLLSGFMLGLGAGSWLAGALVQRWAWSRRTALRAYAATEFAIGVGALVVPLLFRQGERLLLPVGNTDSFHYLASSAVIILLSLLPFCLCMGFTFPFMLQALRGEDGESSDFSFLYLANVVGAMCGTLAAPFALVEILGFRATLTVAACANWSAAMASLWLSRPRPGADGHNAPGGVPAVRAAAPAPRPEGSRGFMLSVLFTTGLISLAVEVVWMRAFTPVLTNQVYAFAVLLLAYLSSTWLGSWLYRRQLSRGRELPSRFLLSALALSAFGQLLAADARIRFPYPYALDLWLLLSIVPYCGILGYLTPKLIDEYSAGNPAAAGRAYAVNVVGCVLGPLMASYLLLPQFGVQWSGILLAAPLWCLASGALRRRTGAATTAATSSEPSSTMEKPTPERPAPERPAPERPAPERRRAAARDSRLSRLMWGAATVCGVLAATIGHSREEPFPGSTTRTPLILRDHSATVVAYEQRYTEMVLTVNGVVMTTLTPTTKLMAHLPLCHLPERPRSALMICFGMGTTYRSLRSWDVEATAVELTPSVRDAFGYFHRDASALADEVRRDVVIDDGRRYLRRTTKRFDLITLDPPPPIEAAGTSLLYSTEFYELIKPRLSEQGILQQWLPNGDRKTSQAMLRSIVTSFPYVRMMRAYDIYGYYILASLKPIERLSASELDARLPERARRDMTEWTPGLSAESIFETILGQETDYRTLLSDDPRVIVTDDHPFNEYYLLRYLHGWWTDSNYGFIDPSVK